MDGDRKEITHSDSVLITNDLPVALDRVRTVSVLLFRDCRRNTQIDVAGGGRALINTKVGPIKL